MHPTPYDDLLQRVQQRCLLEATDPTSFALISQHNVRGHRTTTTENGWCWPPATTSQLDLTEALLGFPLPLLLRQLYQSVGNGGFGPAYGIIGVYGGAPHAGGWHTNIIDAYQDRYYADNDEQALPEIDGHHVGRRTSIPLTAMPATQEYGRYFKLPTSQWPEYLLPLCYWGCNTEHAIHAQTGAMYVVVDGSAFALWAHSLDEWLEKWLAGSLRQE